MTRSFANTGLRWGNQYVIDQLMSQISLCDNRFFIYYPIFFSLVYPKQANLKREIKRLGFLEDLEDKEKCTYLRPLILTPPGNTQIKPTAVGKCVVNKDEVQGKCTTSF